MRVVSRRSFLRNAAAGVVVLGGAPSILAACANDEPTEGSNGGGGGEVSDLTFQAAWVNDAEFMGYFIALELGLYEEDGLNLEYKPGGPDIIPEAQLLAGSAQVALTTPDATIKAITDEGAPFKIIGTQYQKNPIGVVSLAKNNINEPSDLIGKTLASPSQNFLTVEAMLRINDIPEDAVKVVPYQFDPTPLIQGEVDATIDFVLNVPYSIQEQGEEPSSFLLYDWGFTTYNDTVVVTEETLETRRDDIVGWLRASRKGWEENFKDVTKWPPMFEGSWFEGSGRSIENEVYFNTVQQPLIESPNGIFSMTDEDIDNNLRALAEIDIQGTPDMFVTDLVEEI